jgi:hypothetical protein
MLKLAPKMQKVPETDRPDIPGKVCLPSWRYADGHPGCYRKTDLRATFERAKADIKERRVVKVGVCDD